MYLHVLLVPRNLARKPGSCIQGGGLLSKLFLFLLVANYVLGAFPKVHT